MLKDVEPHYEVNETITRGAQWSLSMKQLSGDKAEDNSVRRRFLLAMAIGQTISILCLECFVVVPKDPHETLENSQKAKQSTMPRQKHKDVCHVCACSNTKGWKKFLF